MVCATHPYEARRSNNQPANAPSPPRIRQLTADIRNSWTPQTRVARAVVGERRLELLLGLVRELCNQQCLIE